MFTQSGMQIVVMTIVYLCIANTALATSTDMEQEDQQKPSTRLFGQFNAEPNYILTDRPYYSNDVDTDAIFHTKRQLKKKWAKYIQGSQSPYTIAFPALIRTRRWIDQEQ
ncbi:unnamed protein product [Rotaria socialis]|uniref:Uncharacterized protein n=1 Tax=Rotaria socialis TaxID=392032 RepID=A0A817SPN9_9BILA|nr:unnamed protein product [Rotaria socialis]CAF3298038.1 unnamed protein product [Rotaria socialis]CAF3317901.1 unnamed protein product [Rotaria socialis]CAF3318876.1 unnamed protein product [Rotaria socialis]CAF3357306.1 unnamed protein product [Rotaria socialis]